ncbi:efflux RND transporter permease subunit [Verrucomicrobia bacterium]|nr:efflux RND transporter permease subunit [Verrucomicrobiota bacterium]MDB4663518.1 efflux RND transporter permease subunit [Verrucomicrobiota bacterium]
MMDTHNMVVSIARFSIKRRITMFVVFLTIVAVGVISAVRLPLEMNPRGLEGHYMSVNVRWNVGVPPETMDKIGLPLEEELSTVRGLKSIETHGYKWGSRVELHFKHGTDMDVAYREVRDRAERARLRFPEDVDRTYIYKHQPGAEPVVGFRISYDPSSDYYTLIEKHVIAPIQRIMGVADVEFRIYRRIIKIEVDKQRAEAHGINIRQLGQLLRSDNFTLASGSVVDGGKKFRLKSSTEFNTLEEIKNIPVRPDVFLKDIAQIVYEPEEAERLYRYNSQPANGIQVKREGEANTVEVSKRVVAAIDEIKTNPKLKGFDLSVYDNQGEEIMQRLNHLISNGQLGAVMAAVVLFFFLRQFRMTMIIALAIPLCLLIALAAMFFMGQTLNSLTIMGLVICVGLLVDNSVVMAENIHRHHQDGASRLDACLRGVSEIGFAITIATLTTLIVFGSTLLIDGEMRFYAQNMSLPVIASIAASLGTALMFIPLCVYLTLPKTHAPNEGQTKHFSGFFGRVFKVVYMATFERFNRGYNAALKFFLKRRLDLSVILIALLAVTWWMGGTLNMTDKKADLIRYFRIHVKFPEKFTMDQRLAYFKKVEDLVEKNKEVYGLKAHEVHYGKWYGLFAGFFAPDRVSELTREEAIDKLYEDFPEAPGVRVQYKGKEGSEKKDDQKNMHYVRLVGDDPELLKEVAENLKPTFEMIPGVVSFLSKDTDEDGPSELALYVDREKASSIGINPSTLAGTIGTAVRGENLPRFNYKGRQIPMNLLFNEEDRSELADLDNFQIPTEDGRVSTVGAVTRTAFLNNEDNAITRRDKKVSEYFGMKLKPGPDGWKIKRAIEEAKKNINLPEGVSFDRPQKTIDDEDRKQGSIMLILSIVFVYMIMAFFFESMLIPLSIILTIPLASMGAVLALKMSNTFIDQMVYTGAMFLVGIVVNNGIVLVDYANRLRRSGVERSEALLRAAKHRFRPIIMTAMTTICGMIPLTFGNSVEMGVNFKSFGLVLIGGMTSATLFTLLAVPVFYTLIEDAREKVTFIVYGIFNR